MGRQPNQTAIRFGYSGRFERLFLPPHDLDSALAVESKGIVLGAPVRAGCPTGCFLVFGRSS
jgi:hypothetical protein